jgi:hypothetical protein
VVISWQKHNKILLTFCALNLLYCIDLHHLLVGDDGLEPKIIPDENIHDSMLEELEEQNIKKINALFCYVDNAYRDPKKDQTFLIYKKEFEQYKIKRQNNLLMKKIIIMI